MRSIIWYIYFWVVLLFTLPRYFKVKSLLKKDKVEAADVIINKQVLAWAQRVVKLSGSTVEIIGEENIPKDKSVVFIANHQSSFDIPLLLGYINKPKGFIAKAEIKKLPVVGNWMKFMKCVFMERTDPRAALRSIKEGIEIVKNGHSLVIFPEGTRSADGELCEFKPGSFKLALKSKAPIIPITIKGSIDIMRKGSKKIKPAHVKIVISAPVDSTEYKPTESFELREKIAGIIREELGKK